MKKRTYADDEKDLDLSLLANAELMAMCWRSWRTGSLRSGARGWYLTYRAGKDGQGTASRPTQFLGSHDELRNREAAERAAKVFLTKVFTVERAPGASPGWVAYCNQYLQDQVELMRPESRATVRSVIRRHIKPRFAELQLHQVTPKLLQRWIVEQRAAGAPVSTIKHRLGVVMTMLHLAADCGLAVELPTRRLRYPKTNALKRSREQLVFAPAEASAIIAAAEFPARAAFALALDLGLRASEIVGLTWQNVDLANGEILVEGQAQHGERVLPKTHESAAALVMPAELVDVLTEYRAMCPVGALVLFPNREGRPMTHDNLRRRHLHPLCERLGIPARGLHAFRRRLADSAIAAGATLPTLQGILRHAHATTTLRYLSPATSADVKAALATTAATHRRRPAR